MDPDRAAGAPHARKGCRRGLRVSRRAAAVRGVYRFVHVQVREVRSGLLIIDAVDADLTHVRVPFHDVLGRDVRDVRFVGVGQPEATARLSYPALSTYLDATGRALRPALAPDGLSLTLFGTLTVLDRA